MRREAEAVLFECAGLDGILSRGEAFTCFPNTARQVDVAYEDGRYTFPAPYAHLFGWTKNNDYLAKNTGRVNPKYTKSLPDGYLSQDDASGAVTMSLHGVLFHLLVGVRPNIFEFGGLMMTRAEWTAMEKRITEGLDDVPTRTAILGELKAKVPLAL